MWNVRKCSAAAAAAMADAINWKTYHCFRTNKLEFDWHVKARSALKRIQASKLWVDWIGLEKNVSTIFFGSLERKAKICQSVYPGSFRALSNFCYLKNWKGTNKNVSKSWHSRLKRFVPLFCCFYTYKYSLQMCFKLVSYNWQRFWCAIQKFNAQCSCQFNSQISNTINIKIVRYFFAEKNVILKLTAHPSLKCFFSVEFSPFCKFLKRYSTLLFSKLCLPSLLFTTTFLSLTNLTRTKTGEKIWYVLHTCTY
jgi:hypothetical protein